MSFVKKRNWKTVELDELDMAEFANIGGLELEVLSDDGDYGKMRQKTSPEEQIKKQKKKKKKTTTTKSVEAETPTGPSSVTFEEAAEEPHKVDMSKWAEFGLNSTILLGLTKLGFTNPSPIQSSVIGKSLEGFDILGAAQTGSGKTLAFGLPILHAILGMKQTATQEASIKGLCILPTRELAIQVHDHLEAVGVVTIGTVVGGMSVEKQLRVLGYKPDVVVGTPGRIAGLLGISKKKEESQISASFRNELCEHLKFLVLDEADRLLEQSHFRDLTSILTFIYNSVPNTASIQSFIFSATLPVDSTGDLNKLIRKLRLKPADKRHIVDLVASSDKSLLAVPSGLKFSAMFRTCDEDREPFLMYYLFQKLVKSPASGRIIVFVNAISYVYRLTSLLSMCFPGVRIGGMHSNMRQKDRLKKLDQFKASMKGILVATDLAARGLDLPHVDAVVHLQPPRTSESLIHRSGRTARAGRSGECVLIITPTQVSAWNKAVRIGLNKDIEEIPVIDAVSIDIRQVREIQRLATTIEGQSHKEKRENKDRAWSKKICEEADLWDSDASFSDDSDDGSYATGRNKEKKVSASDVAKFEELVSNPLPSIRK
jgi:ATP-dependent RNA helicase DDX24/MAK5